MSVVGWPVGEPPAGSSVIAQTLGARRVEAGGVDAEPAVVVGAERGEATRACRRGSPTARRRCRPRAPGPRRRAARRRPRSAEWTIVTPGQLAGHRDRDGVVGLDHGGDLVVAVVARRQHDEHADGQHDHRCGRRRRRPSQRLRRRPAIGTTGAIGASVGALAARSCGVAAIASSTLARSAGGGASATASASTAAASCSPSSSARRSGRSRSAASSSVCSSSRRARRRPTRASSSRSSSSVTTAPPSPPAGGSTRRGCAS